HAVAVSYAPHLRRPNAVVDLVTCRPMGDDSRHTELTLRTAKRLQRDSALINRFGVADGDDRDGPVRAFQQPCEDVARAELNEKIAAKIDETLHAICPPHSASDLIA